MGIRSRAAVLPLLAGLALLCSATRATATTGAVGAILTSPPPVSLTAANKSFPFQLHGWLPPYKNTTLGALGRAAASVTSNTTNPLNATKALTTGLALHKRETAALLKGQSGLVTYASSVAASTAAPSDLVCYVDSATGQLVGLEQGGSTACSTTTSVVTVPTASSPAGTYISQIKLAYTYDGAFVGRLVFYLKANATSKESVAYTCGSAGGKAVDLLPNANKFAVTKLNVGCSTLPAIDGGAASSGRRLRASAPLTSGPGLGLSASTFGAVAASLSLLPVDPTTGVPQTQPIGDVLVPGGGPSPGPGPVPTSPPTVSLTTTAQLINSNTLIITGTNFDASNPANNLVVLSGVSTGLVQVTAATATQLTVALVQLPTNIGTISAVAATAAGTSGAPVQVAVVSFPAVSGAPATSPWRAIASSADGTKMVATASTGNIWLSSDRGATWTANSGTNGAPASGVYVSAAMSGDGTKILVAYNNAVQGGLYLSVDSGATWTVQTSAAPFPTNEGWNAVAMSKSGSVLAAGIDSSITGQIYLSRDMGVTWVLQASGLPSAARYTGLTVSDDGMKIVANTFSTTGDMYYTTDGGTTWLTPTGSPTAARWQGVASSADGSEIISCDSTTASGDLWLSTDSGANFAAQAAGLAVPTVWRTAATSDDFTKIAVGVQTGGIFLSSNSGAAFSAATGGGLPTSAAWRSIAMSSDGSVLGVIGTNQLWVSYDSGVTFYQR